MEILNYLRTLFIFLFSRHFLVLGSNLSDSAALLAFKSGLVLRDSDMLSRSWNSQTHFCRWFGVSCLNQRVVSLQLPDLALQGTVTSSIGNLSHLVRLDLGGNHLEGALPSELGFLQHLRILNVTSNYLQGSIPFNISKCQKLQELYLSENTMTGSIPNELGLLGSLRILRLNNNNLTGNIPASFGNFSDLEYLYLHENNLENELPARLGDLSNLKLLSLRGNNFTGSIPPSIFNISALQVVDMSINRLSGQLPGYLGSQLINLERLFLDSNRITGDIPVSLGNASRLTFLFFTENDLKGSIPDAFDKLIELQWFEFESNQISGNIPSGIFNISSLRILKARHNYLEGHLPADLGRWLPNLEEIFLSHNQFSGELPLYICNASKLVNLEVSNNSFSGPVPPNLGNLIYLESLILQYNLLHSNLQSGNLEFLEGLVNCRKLIRLALDSNPLNGMLPDSIGNLSSNLLVIAAYSCQIKGKIPKTLGNLSSLLYLGLAGNKVEGNIPSSFVGLQNLERLYLTNNKLEGPISTELCSIRSLGAIHLGENKFSGSIPLCIENLTELRELTLAANNFQPVIPLNFWRLTKLEGLNLSKNVFQGPIPGEIGNLKGVRILDFSSNNFSGEIPDSIGYLQNLVSLDMSSNSFHGSIPSTLNDLIALEALDLSSNFLSGPIPNSLGSLQNLKYLNLSFNRLQGEIPHNGIFANLTSQSLMGNTYLCGAPDLGFPLCPPPASTTKSKKFLVLKITLPIVGMLLLLAAFLLTWMNLPRKTRKQGKTEPSSFKIVGPQYITYLELLQATDDFNSANLLGSGSSSTVFKGTLSDGTLAAIKVFNMQSDGVLKNFAAECEVLRDARHRNLVKIISTCSNMDFAAMILEYMPNGSLDMWLHSDGYSLNLLQRLAISMDIALALEYLHHDYVVPVVHCDLKPSNVLLDEDLVAHVADFGISKVLAQDGSAVQTRTLGTIGYLAPEQGIDGQISTSGDVYSFGILLLEIFTGKKPTDDRFGEDLTLPKWVNGFFPDALMEILDTNLLDDIKLIPRVSIYAENEKWFLDQQLLVSTIHVALLCLKDSPEDRINMRDVVVRLKKIKAESSILDSTKS